MSIRRIAAVAALVLLPSTACSSPQGDGVATAGDGSGQPTVSASEEDHAVKMRQYQQCMQEHGVAIAGPDATARPPDTDSQTLQNAMTACQSLLPSGGDLVNETPEELEARRRTAQCMRDNGYPQWPDPVPGVGTLKLPREIDPFSPEVKATLNECSKKAQSP
jgi:hypothetical protein